MYFLIYKVTNLNNGKSYIGAHKTSDIDDGYMGSGKVLRRAIDKHGIDRFHREVLFVYKTSEEMYAKEAELVTEEWVSCSNNYNLKVGGSGGFDYINNNPEIVAKNRERGIDNLRRARQNGHTQVGEKNSQYGTMWITDGNINKKIMKDSVIPDGFRKGRSPWKSQTLTKSS